MIYLASPYGHPDPEIRRYRFRVVSRVAARLMKGGTILFCPITHSHPINEVWGDTPGWKFWQEFDKKMLYICSAIWVVTMPGWQESVGVKAEIAYMSKLGRGIYTVSPLPSEIEEDDGIW